MEAPRIDPQRVVHHDIPISQNRDIDLLFMVDKSPTMADEQAALASNFPRFINVLQNIPGGLPNVHIGVITQDIGAGGSVPENAGFLREDAYLGIIILSDEDDCSAFDGNVFTPTNGSLTDPLGPLSDFRCAEFGWTCDGGPVARAPAVYGSCVPREQSPFLKHPREYVEFIRNLKTDPSLVIVAGIIGDDTRFEIGPTNDSFMNPEVKPSCMTATQSAEPMPRIRHFAQQFQDRNSFVSICNDDLAPGLVVIAELLARVIGNRCLDGQVDTRDRDAAQPGLQLDCQASEGRPEDGVWREELALPRCVMADDTTPVGEGEPCWYVVADAVNCAAAPSQLAIKTHPAERMPPPGTRLKLQCVGAQL